MTGAGVAAVAGGGLLAACGERTGGKGEAEAVQEFEHLVPRYVAWNQVQLPESSLLPGKTNEHGMKVPDGLIQYPRELVRAVAEPFGNGNTYTSMTPLWSPPPDYPNDYYRAIAERMGTTVEFNPRDGVEYRDIVIAVLGAQDHPHLTMIPQWEINLIPRISEAVDNLFADLTPFLSGDISQRWPLLANLPTSAWLEGVWNGKLKALPQPAQDPFGNPLFARKDILDALGLPWPTTSDELLEIGRELTKPGENRWAFGNMRPYLVQMFRSPDQDWRLEEDGSLLHWIETEQGRAAVEFERQLFEEGLVHPDVSGSAEADAKQLFRSGELVFRTDGWGDWQEALASVLPDNPDYNQQPVPVFAYDGGEPMVHGTDPAWAYTFLHRDLTDAQIEEVLDVANWAASPYGTEEYEMHQFGVEGVHFERGETGQPQLTEQGEAEAGQPVPTYYFLCGRPAEPFQAGGDWPGYVESRLEWSNHAVDYVEPRIFAGIRRIEPEALQRANQQRDDAIENFVRGRTSDFAKLVEDWRTNGGEEGREFYQQALQQRDEQLEGGT